MSGDKATLRIEDMFIPWECDVALFHARGEDAAELSPAAALKSAGRYISTEGFDLYDRRTIGSDDMLVMRRHWHRGVRRGQTEAS